VFSVRLGTLTTKHSIVERKIPPNIHCCDKIRPAALFIRRTNKLSLIYTMNSLPSTVALLLFSIFQTQAFLQIEVSFNKNCLNY